MLPGRLLGAIRNVSFVSSAARSLSASLTSSTLSFVTPVANRHVGSSSTRTVTKSTVITSSAVRPNMAMEAKSLSTAASAPGAAVPVADPARFNLYPKDVGVLAMDIYFPSQYCAQEDLEKFDNVGAGKYTVGLGQQGLAFVNDREDIYSICLTAVVNLMEKYQLSYKDIGRLEVATETILDHSKSIKTVLMQLFADSGNTDVEGVDTYNACYAGTNALFNSAAWVESSNWDGRYAIVVAADIAEYAKGNARPTGGCGAVAFLVGPNAPLALERGVRASHMEHVYDFYKPNLDSPYPVVDGKYSNVCYLRSLDTCYQTFVQKYKKLHGTDFDLSMADYVAFHAPYNKLVQKSFGRLAYNDFLRFPDRPEYKDVKQFQAVSKEASYDDRNLESAFVKLSAADYQRKVMPTALLPQQLGNMYTASLYAGLLSLLYSTNEQLANKRVLCFSYGSGSAATLFSFKVGNSDEVKASLKRIQRCSNLSDRLNKRARTAPEDFSKTMDLRETLYKQPGSYEPQAPTASLFPGTFYLTKKDDLARRSYARAGQQ